MDRIKTILHILFLPLIFLATVIICLVYGKDKDTLGWYQTVWQKGSTTEKVIAVLITPIIVPIAWIMDKLFDLWDGLVN